MVPHYRDHVPTERRPARRRWLRGPVNLASPGTYDATPQGSPGWDEENGWKNFTTVDYLNTGIKPGATYSAVVRHAGSVGTTDNGFGGYEAPNRFYLGRSAATGYVGHGGYYQLSTQFSRHRRISYYGKWILSKWQSCRYVFSPVEWGRLVDGDCFYWSH